MNAESPYNANPELSKMKEDVAGRSYGLMIKNAAITALGVVAGVAVGALFTGTFLGPMALVAGGALGLMAGGGIAEMVTMKERTKLKIDEEMVQSYMSGKNHWGAGYRQEVAEYGYAGPQATPQVGDNGPQRPRGSGRG